MKDLFRIKGLVLFLVVICLICLFWYVFIDGIVKRTLETAAGTVTGTEVRVGDADVTLFPLGVSLNDITVADGDDPADIVCEIEGMSFLLDTSNLLMRKILVDEMSLTGVAFPEDMMSVSGAEAMPAEGTVPEETPEETPGFKDLFAEVDVKEIISREELKTLELVNSLQEEVETRQAFWEKRIDELPDDEKIDQYRTRLDEIRDARDTIEIIDALRKAKALEKDIRSDVELIRSTKEELEKDYVRLESRLDEVSKVPAEDARRLSRKYSPNLQGIGNVAVLLFGERTGLWVERGLTAYTRMEPVIERVVTERRGRKTSKPVRGAGEDVHFLEYEPSPDLLVRTARTTIRLEQGELVGVIENITPDQDILGSPLRFEFSSTASENIGGISLKGHFDRVNPEKKSDVVMVDVKDYRLRNTPLGGESLQLNIESAMIGMNVLASAKDSSFNADIMTTLDDVSFSSKKGGDVMDALLAALEGTSRFYVRTNISGTFSDYSVSLSSDLDSVVENTLENLVTGYVSSLDRELEDAITEYTGADMQEVKDELSSIGILDQELTERLQLVNSLLGSDLLRGKSLRFPF